MKKIVKLIITVLTCATASLAIADQAKPIKVAIVAPAEIAAMDEIIKGFEEQLTAQYSGKVIYIVKNAQGEINIQRAILQQFKESDADIIAPIATQPSQMAISMIHDKPIVMMAADIDSDTKPANVTGVLDEVSVTKQMTFIHKVNPELKKLTLVYSASDKVFPEVKEAEQAAQKMGIKIQKLMMQQLSDLYAIGQQVASDSDAIFVFKDALIVSGMETLVNQGKMRGIPVIASDDGSVQKGAAYALGVSEKQIGVDSANVTLEVINGKSPKDIPIFVMKDYIVFVNPQSAKAQGVDVASVKKVAANSGYAVKEQ